MRRTGKVSHEDLQQRDPLFTAAYEDIAFDAIRTSLMTTKIINVVDTIDRSRLGRLQYFVLGLCMLSLIIDGFDVQAMGYVHRQLSNNGGLPKQTLVPCLVLVCWVWLLVL